MNMKPIWEGDLGGGLGGAIWLISLRLIMFKSIFCPARQEIENWGEEKMAGGGRLSLSGLARFGSVLVGSSPKVGIWCRRDVTFPKQVAFAVGETTLDFSNVNLV